MALVRSRRILLRFGILLMAQMLFTAASSKTEDTRPGDTHPGTSLAGQLLVATPEMGDPRFQHTVILMVQHDQKGALGIVINRPLEQVPLAKMLDALGLDSKGSDGQVRLFAGGPVQPEIGFIVHSADYRRSGTVNIDGHVAMTTDPEALQLTNLFETIPMLAGPVDLWGRAADFGRVCRKAGLTAGSIDLLIAAVAVYHTAELVTFDVDFQKIGTVSGLRVDLLTRPG